MARPSLIKVVARDLFYAQILIEDVYFYKQLGHANKSDVRKLIKNRQYNLWEVQCIVGMLKKLGLYQESK